MLGITYARKPKSTFCTLAGKAACRGSILIWGTVAAGKELGIVTCIPGTESRLMTRDHKTDSRSMAPSDTKSPLKRPLSLTKMVTAPDHYFSSSG